MKLAVNGTPFPIDDRCGIPEMIFKGTLEHFSEDKLARFRRRMCGSSGQTEEFLSHTPTRTAEELREELAALALGITAYGSSSFIWDRAIIGNRDKISRHATNMRHGKERKSWKRKPNTTRHRCSAVCSKERGKNGQGIDTATFCESDRQLRPTSRNAKTRGPAHGRGHQKPHPRQRRLERA